MPLNGFLDSMDFPFSLEEVRAMAQLFFLGYRSAEALVISTKNCSPSKERPLTKSLIIFSRTSCCNCSGAPEYTK